jgi:hypothetical protein
MTAVASPSLIDVTALGPIDPWVRSAEETGLRRTLRQRLKVTEIGVLTTLALTFNIIVGFYLHYRLHFWINDEINRTTDAVYVAISRDPHLGAIGFYWPPLPQLIQIPLVVVLEPFGRTIMAGPISSAFCMALTIPFLARIGRLCGLGRPTVLLICISFAINPVVVYYSANGMSEACFFLTGSIMLYGFLRYLRNPDTTSILIFTFGMSGVAMTRLEGPFVDLAMVTIAAFNLKDLRRSAWNFFVLGLPPALFFGFWLAVQWILEKDPLFFHHQSGGGAPPKPGTAVWLPNTAADPLSAFPWAFHWVLVLGPALIIVCLSVLIGFRTGRTRGSIGIACGMGVFLAIQIDQVIKGTGFGDPRYFVMAILFATVGVIWVASNGRAWWSPVWNLGLVSVLVIAGGVGSYTLTSAKTTHVEHECVFFEDGVARYLPFLGRTQKTGSSCPVPLNGLKAWATATAWLDHHMTSKDRVLTDNSAIPFPDLFTDHPDQYIVENDRDWHKTVSNPYFVTYIISQSGSPTGPPDASDSDQGAVLINSDRADWKLVGHWGPAYNIDHGFTNVQIYRYVGPPRSQAPGFLGA